jgi:hypothetical protein
MDPRQGTQDVDVSQADVLTKVFSRENVAYTLKRLASARDKDNLIAHPLRSAILVEFEEQLSETISRRVISRSWSPSASYLCFTNKRSGSYRELVFPSLIDSVVGRRAIDALEKRITEDDNDRTFCGRSHASTNREPGDYSNWFQTWIDYTSKIASAARGEGLAYVFDTDVADFFPSINRDRAKQFLAQRTGAHASLIELIFYCLEAWLPRFDYLPMTGLPIEPNDISRLVAHNYLKIIDAEFPDSEKSKYVRYVDDSTIFVPDREAAEEVKRRHHMSLRGIGLNPNAAKSGIVTVEEYENSRHREANLRIDVVDEDNNEEDFNALVTEWYIDRSKDNWDRPTKRLYRTASKHVWLGLRPHVLADLSASPYLTESVIDYLLHLANVDEYLEDMLKFWNREEGNTERLIHFARFLCDGSFTPQVSERIADFAVGRIIGADDRPGSGYARALLLLALHKHGQRKHREKVLAWGSVATLQDEQLRMHFIYVFVCRNELPENLRVSLLQLASSDTDLLLQLCEHAFDGKVRRATKILNRYIRKRGNCRSVEARVLPLLSALAKSRNEGVEKWFEKLLEPQSKSVVPIRDAVLLSLLSSLRAEMVS